MKVTLFRSSICINAFLEIGLTCTETLAARKGRGGYGETDGERD